MIRARHFALVTALMMTTGLAACQDGGTELKLSSLSLGSTDKTSDNASETPARSAGNQSKATGDSIVVHMPEDRVQGAAEFSAARFGATNLAATDAPLLTRGVIGKVPRFEPISNLPKSDPAWTYSRSVGRLDVLTAGNLMRVCTASLIADDLILTNYHCFGHTAEKFRPVKMELVMDYYSSASARDSRRYPVSLDPVEASKAMDYVVLKVSGKPGQIHGTVKLSDAAPVPGTNLLVVHHPQGRPKHLSREGCRTTRPTANRGEDVYHLCDTLTGSSGSPIFDARGEAVVALHYAGFVQPTDNPHNYAKSITALRSVSPVIRGVMDHKDAVSPTEPVAVAVVTEPDPVPAPVVTVTAPEPDPVPAPVVTVAAPEPDPVPAPVVAVTVPEPNPVPAPVVTVTAPEPDPVPAPVVTVTAPEPDPVPAPVVTVTAPEPDPVPAPVVTVTAPEPDPVPAPVDIVTAPEPDPVPTAVVSDPAPQVDLAAAPAHIASEPKTIITDDADTSTLKVDWYRPGEFAALDYYPDTAFDLDLSHLMRIKTDQIVVDATGAKFTTSELPAALQPWLNRITETGGKVRAVAVQTHGGLSTRSFFSDVIELVVEAISSLWENVIYGPAEGYDATLYFDSETGDVQRIEFSERDDS